jgi:hypothetical protein
MLGEVGVPIEKSDSRLQEDEPLDLRERGFGTGATNVGDSLKESILERDDPTIEESRV